MELTNLTDLLKAVVIDLYTAEQQMIKTLQRLTTPVETEELRREIDKRIEEAKGHLTRLDEVCEQLDIRPSDEENPAVSTLLSEAESLIERGSPEVQEAALILAIQKTIHYKVACYGSAREYAKKIRENDTAELLAKTVEEEKKADERLSDLAVSFVNEKATEEA